MASMASIDRSVVFHRKRSVRVDVSIEAIDGWDGCRWVVGGGATGDGTRARARTMEAMEADDVERGDGDGESAFDALSDGREWSLGFLERARDETTTRRERFPSKAGGAPAWLDPVRVPYDEELRAEDGETLDFLLQVYAPVDEEPTAFHRTVYVFASSSGGETHGPRGCRAFRGQLPRENAYYAWDPLPEGMLGRELSREEADARRARCDRWDVSARECEAEMRAPTKTYPEYELVVETEERDEMEASEAMKYVNGTGGEDMTADDVEEIEAEVVNKDMEQLATFHVMLKNDPDQVLRYCPEPGAKPVWPSVTHAPNTDVIPCCERCGAPRKFEFQILPTIISQLGVDAESDYALDFGSVAVYTCSKSCAPVPCDETNRRTGAYAEEYVVVHPPLNQ